jgi:hypothetical protein
MLDYLSIYSFLNLFDIWSTPLLFVSLLIIVNLFSVVYWVYWYITWLSLPLYLLHMQIFSYLSIYLLCLNLFDIWSTPLLLVSLLIIVNFVSVVYRYITWLSLPPYLLHMQIFSRKLFWISFRMFWTMFAYFLFRKLRNRFAFIIAYLISLICPDVRDFIINRDVSRLYRILLKGSRFLNSVIRVIRLTPTYWWRVRWDPNVKTHIFLICFILSNIIQLILYLQPLINPVIPLWSIPKFPFFWNPIYLVLVCLVLYGHFLFLGSSNDMIKSPADISNYINRYFLVYVFILFQVTSTIVCLSFTIIWLPWVLTFIIFLLIGILLI